MREAMRFFVGLHDVHVAHRFDLACVSVNRLRRRKKAPFEVHRWIIDSGAFTELSQHGHYRHDVAEYAAEVRRWRHLGTVRGLLWSADSMAWSYSARKQGRDPNDWREAKAFEAKVLDA